jgi:peptidoglycan/xylan/chitin deacetylase (PgdA/CDA1 family)
MPDSGEHSMTALGQALVIAYNGIGDGPSPPFIERRVLQAQLDCLSDCGVQTLTVSELGGAVLDGSLPPRAVAITFHGGLRSVLEEAAPLLVERGFTATAFCVASRIERAHDWSSLPGALRRPLLGTDDVAELSRNGFEIGSQGMNGVPLDALSADAQQREVAGSRALLEQLTGVSVTSFAFPHGPLPGPDGRARIEETYSAACGGSFGTVTSDMDPFALPFVEAHHLRRPGVLRRALVGSFPPYLRARRASARVRRLLLSDELVPSG